MNVASTMFWVLIGLVGYTWFVYPVALLCLSILHRRSNVIAGELFTVTMVIPVYNEEKVIQAKLLNCLSLAYPNHLLEIIVVSDGSNDGTVDLVKSIAETDSRLRLIELNHRVGKSSAQNLAIKAAHGQIVLLTDANTFAGPDFLKTIVEDFADSDVGLVGGAVVFGKYDDGISKGQGLYWRYELFLRQLESDIGILATASGAAMAVRKDLLRPLSLHFGDDCIIPLDVRRARYKVIHNARAVVFDEMPHSIDGELRARIRMTSRNWAGTLSKSELLNPFRFPGTAWGLVSHKLLRWLTPFLLAIAIGLNAFLAIRGQLLFVLMLQGAFYGAAMIGWARAKARKPESIFGPPFAFCLANFGFMLGVLHAIRGQRIVAYR